MTFEYRIPVRRGRTLPDFPAQPTDEPVGRPLRLARLVALSHHLEEMVRSGRVQDYHELARRAAVAPTRISQIVILGQLAPKIQEYVLNLSIEHAGRITEPKLREIARELRWDRQLSLFRQLLSERR